MENSTIHLLVCDKTVTSEVGCDYSMPDYQPEIRRLLRVRATVVPPSSYVGAGKAEFAGTVRYDILYSGNDGALYSATTAENYELSAPLDKDADVDYSDDILAYCAIQPEVLTSRVTAPRKLSIRCRLRGQIKAFGRHRLCERMIGDVPENGIERLPGERQGAVLCRPVSENLTLSEEMTVDGGRGELRVIMSERAVNVTETVPSGEGVGCRGEMTLKVLVCYDGEDSVPFAVTRRVPFSVTVPADDFTSDTVCRAVGCCTEINTEVTGDGRIVCDASATVTVEGQKNVPVSYTADLYAVECENKALYTEYRFPVAERCYSGNFTQSVYEPLSSFGIADDCEILDVCAAGSVENVTFDRGKWVLGGESRVGLLMRVADEYAFHEIGLPFRCEFDGEGGEPMLTGADVTMVSGRARSEGGRLGIECEMAISARICTEGSLLALTEAQFGERVSKPAEMVVAFPAKGETLWSLGKRYHVPLSALARLNGISAPPSETLAAGEPVVVNE